jgi:hypothetical protein
MKAITGRFRLDEAKARALIARALERYEDNEDGDEPNYETLRLPEGWEPRDADETDTVYDLVYAAGACGAIVAPKGAEPLEFQFMDDSDGGVYQYRVELRGANLRLVSGIEEYHHIGMPGMSGTEAAMAILNEAVEQANYVLDAAAKA